MARWLPVVAACLGLGGCSAAGTLAVLTATPMVTATSDLSYAEGPRHGVDVYRPRGGGAHPVVVFFYGGNWDSGSRQAYRFVGQSLAAQGYLTIIPDYRVYPQVLYPDFLQDNAKAVRWARDHAMAYGGDPHRLFLMGHSAGAYNAAMLTYDQRLLAAVGMDPNRDVKGFIGLAGPYDFLPLSSERLKIIFGPQDTRPATQPVAYVDGDEPPALLLHGLKDTTVEPANADRMAARIRQKGGRVAVIKYAGLSHPMILGALAGPLRLLAPVMRDTTAFIDREAGR